MSAKTWSLEEIESMKPKCNELILHEGYVFYITEHARIRRAWKKQNGEYKEVDLKSMVNEIVAYLKDNITLEDFIRAKITQLPPKYLEDLHERVEHKGEIIQRPRCYELEIKGKKGSPMVLVL